MHASHPLLSGEKVNCGAVVRQQVTSATCWVGLGKHTAGGAGSKHKMSIWTSILMLLLIMVAILQENPARDEEHPQISFAKVDTNDKCLHSSALAFESDWGACVQEEHPEINFVKVDTTDEELAKLADEEGVTVLPTFKFYRESKEVQNAHLKYFLNLTQAAPCCSSSNFTRTGKEVIPLTNHPLSCTPFGYSVEAGIPWRVPGTM